ncbi:MAG TPA: hypothetical protein VJO34_04870 [Methylomirabilota bacterium]|nr:hypothetical protein [Methylomirabilota bacterium]
MALGLFGGFSGDPIGPDPHHVAFNLDGTLAYIVSAAGDEVVEISR